MVGLHHLLDFHIGTFCSCPSVLVTYFLHLPEVEIQDRKIIITTLASLTIQTAEQQKVKHHHINTKGVSCYHGNTK